jgi:hypothetical protein
MVYRLSSFDEVAKAYDGIKPIKGGRASQDLRVGIGGIVWLKLVIANIYYWMVIGDGIVI